MVERPDVICMVQTRVLCASLMPKRELHRTRGLRDRRRSGSVDLLTAGKRRHGGPLHVRSAVNGRLFGRSSGVPRERRASHRGWPVTVVEEEGPGRARSARTPVSGDPEGGPGQQIEPAGGSTRNIVRGTDCYRAVGRMGWNVYPPISTMPSKPGNRPVPACNKILRKSMRSTGFDVSEEDFFEKKVRIRTNFPPMEADIAGIPLPPSYEHPSTHSTSGVFPTLKRVTRVESVSKMIRRSGVCGVTIRYFPSVYL